jgi:hypothetical protein
MPIGPNEHISNNFVCYVDVYWLYIAPCGGGEKYYLGRGHANTTDNISLACMGMLGCLPQLASPRCSDLGEAGESSATDWRRAQACAGLWRSAKQALYMPLYVPLHFIDLYVYQTFYISTLMICSEALNLLSSLRKKE